MHWKISQKLGYEGKVAKGGVPRKWCCSNISINLKFLKLCELTIFYTLGHLKKWKRKATQFFNLSNTIRAMERPRHFFPWTSNVYKKSRNHWTLDSGQDCCTGDNLSSHKSIQFNTWRFDRLIQRCTQVFADLNPRDNTNALS